jgi:hypothetical protein
MLSGTLINSQDAFMLNTRKVGLMCSVRYCASPILQCSAALNTYPDLNVMDLVYVDVLVNL